MTLQDIDTIRQYPTVINKVHESVYRSYQILDLIGDLLKKGTPADIVFDVLILCRAAPHVEIESIADWNDVVKEEMKAIE